MKKFLKNYIKYYKLLLNYNRLPNLNSKYLIINYYKLFITVYIIQIYYIFLNFYKLNFEFIQNSKKKRKFFGFLNFDILMNSSIHFISRKKHIKIRFIYIKYLNR